jgi:hypothetical protein
MSASGKFTAESLYAKNPGGRMMKNARRFTSYILVPIVLLNAGLAFAEEHQAVAPENPRYLINGAEVYDKKTDLSWQRCSVGQHWVQGTGCVGIVLLFNADAAQQQAGGAWRVPGKEELGTLIDHELKARRQLPTIDEIAFPDMDAENLYYWSSSPAGKTPKGTPTGWNVNFGSGDIFADAERINTNPLRLVRSGK